MGMLNKAPLKSTKAVKMILRLMGPCIAGYGIYAFIARDFPMYMTLKYHFALFDYEEPLIYYLLDHAAIMGLFIGLGHYLGKLLRYRKKQPKKAEA